MSRDPCAPIIRGTYHARHARHVRRGWTAFAAASAVMTGCGGAAGTAVWLASPAAHVVPAARLQKSYSGAVVPFPGTRGWPEFVQAHPLPVVPGAVVAQPEQQPAHVPEPASVAVMAAVLLLAALFRVWRRR